MRSSGNRCCSTAPNRQGLGSERPGRVAAGPERFFYDKSTYTGTHSNGGPEHVAKGIGSHADRSWKRPSLDSTEDMDHLARVTLLSQQGARPPSPLRVNVEPCLPNGRTFWLFKILKP